MRSILFKPEMLLAIDRSVNPKTQTRRTRGLKEINKNPDGWAYLGFSSKGHRFRNIDTREIKFVKYPFGDFGDRLYVKEPHYLYGKWVQNGSTKMGRQKWLFQRTTSAVQYLNDPPPGVVKSGMSEMVGWYKRSSLFMAHRDSRKILEVTHICDPERLQSISERDAIAEGIHRFQDERGWKIYTPTNSLGTSFPVISFKSLIESINGAGFWDANPWVFPCRFKQVE